jgi:HSP20 family protein
MAIVRFDPFRSRWPSIWDWDVDDTMPSTGSDLDIYETADEVVVRANIAGVNEDKIDITFEKGVLWLRGEEDEEASDDKTYYRKASRSYSYKVAVPGNLDLAKDPVATVKDGVVTISFKKAEEAKPKKISIKAS